MSLKNGSPCITGINLKASILATSLGYFVSGNTTRLNHLSSVLNGSSLEELMSRSSPPGSIFSGEILEMFFNILFPQFFGFFFCSLLSKAGLEVMLLWKLNCFEGVGYSTARVINCLRGYVICAPFFTGNCEYLYPRLQNERTKSAK